MKLHQTGLVIAPGPPCDVPAGIATGCYSMFGSSADNLGLKGRHAISLDGHCRMP